MTISWFSSTSSFKTLRRPAYSVAISSSVGAMVRQGPHHAAQKSTRTGTVALMTSPSKVCSVTAAAFPMEKPPRGPSIGQTAIPMPARLETVHCGLVGEEKLPQHESEPKPAAYTFALGDRRLGLRHFDKQHFPRRRPLPVSAGVPGAAVRGVPVPA